MCVGKKEYEQVREWMVSDGSQSRLWFVATFAEAAMDLEGRLRSYLVKQHEIKEVPQDLSDYGVFNPTKAVEEGRFTKLHRLEFEPLPLIKCNQTGEEEVRYLLRAVVMQEYQGRVLGDGAMAATVVYFEFQLTDKHVKEWITGASLLLHVGKGAIEKQLVDLLGATPRTTCVLSFLHLWNNSEDIDESGIQDVAEVLCAGSPGNAEFDQPLGHRPDGIPPGVLRRSDGWFYYASHRRIGCVLLNSRPPDSNSSPSNSEFREKTFPGRFRWNELGIFGIAAIESHFLNRYGDKLVELDSRKTPRRTVAELTAMNLAMLSLRVDLGNGKVSDRHGIQIWYEHVHQGMRIENRFQRFRDSLLSLLDGRQAEIQSKIESSQNILTTLGLFVSGAFAYTTVRETLASEATPEWLELGITSSPMNVFGPMLFWGLAAVVIKQVVWTIVSRLRD